MAGKKIITVVGARPQFVKAAVVSRAFKNHPSYISQAFCEEIVHTGQHYDDNMSSIFFDEMEIPRPHYSLDCGGGSHGKMTGQMMIELEKIFEKQSPSLVLVYGDTNSTLAAALCAAKMHIPLAHVEAGLRSFNRQMPEEINRIVTDSLSQLLFCPSKSSSSQLKTEGIYSTSHPRREVVVSGDVMYDAILFYLEKLNITHSESKINQIMVTLHRQENVDDPQRLQSIVEALRILSKDYDVIFPMHPRTLNQSKKLNIDFGNINLLEPLGYFDLLKTLKKSELVLTDSGGLQKEAYFAGRPCIVLRDETEWTELIEIGTNKLCGAECETIVKTAHSLIGTRVPEETPYGKGKSGEIIVDNILKFLSH